MTPQTPRQIRDKIRKLEQLTEARGATPAEAEAARQAANRLRAKLPASQSFVPPGVFADQFADQFADRLRDLMRKQEEAQQKVRQAQAHEMDEAIRRMNTSVWRAAGCWTP